MVRCMGTAYARGGGGGGGGGGGRGVFESENDIGFLLGYNNHTLGLPTLISYVVVLSVYVKSKLIVST